MQEETSRSTSTSTRGLGISPPLSMEGPSPEELRSSVALEDTLRSLGAFEDDETRSRREKVGTDGSHQQGLFGRHPHPASFTM
jgi:poly(A) polymerase Pap1